MSDEGAEAGAFDFGAELDGAPGIGVGGGFGGIQFEGYVAGGEDESIGTGVLRRAGDGEKQKNAEGPHNSQYDARNRNDVAGRGQFDGANDAGG